MTNNRSIFDKDNVEDYLKIKRNQVKCLEKALDEVAIASQYIENANNLINAISKNLQELQNLIKDYSNDKI